MSTSTQFGRFAVAVGLGAAVLTGGAQPAWADPSDSSSAGSSDSSTSSSSESSSGSSSGSSSESSSGSSDKSGTSTSSGSANTGGSTSAPSTDQDYAEDTDTDTGIGEEATDTAGEDAGITEETDADDPEAKPEETEAVDGDAPAPATATTRARSTAQHDPEPAAVEAPSATKSTSASAAGDGTGKASGVSESPIQESVDPQPAAVHETTTGTVEPAVAESFAAAVAEPEAPAQDAPATAVTTAAAVVTTLLNPLAALGDSDVPASPGLWALFAFVRREFQRTFFNSQPTASPIITSQTDDLVTGSFGAVDADGDPLTYTMIGRGPALGRVSIDQATGTFTYTPVVDFSVLGGSDQFTVQISDGNRIHGLAALWEIPVKLIRSIPVIGSLVSDFLPRTSTTATVTINFTGTGELSDLVFPDGFHWGTSTSGFQSEMGGGAPLDESSDWWQWLHDPLNKLLLGWRGDALPENGPGSYLKYATDAQLAAEGVGADTFRMGIEWSRIFPDSTASVDISGGITEEVLQQLDALANQDEVAHYRDVLTTLHAYGLDPMVTINHFTLPVWVHDPSSARLAEVLGGTPDEGGGWVSESTVAEFEKYAAYVAWKYGDQVTNWIVLNEPMNSMIPAYFAIPLTTGFPPAVLRPDLIAVGLRNQAAAYSASYDIIHQLDSDAQVGLALSMFEWTGANPASAIDQQAAAQFSKFFNTWFPDAVIKGEVDANFNGVIEAGEVHPELAGKLDFFGINYYGQGSVIGFGGSPFPAIPVINGYPQFANLLNVLLGGCRAEECSDAPMVIKPSGLRNMIDLAASYGKPLWITENGLADADDDQRASYVVRHLAVINKAISDGADIRGYIAWSLLDNLEWILGYGEKFGLYSFDPETLERTARPSLAVLNAITTSNSIPAELFQQYVKATGSL